MKTTIILLFSALALAAQTPTTINLRAVAWTTEARDCAEAMRLTMGVSGNYSLASNILASDAAGATFTLADATGIPATGQLVIESEALDFSYPGSGVTLTIVKRGASITTKSKHDKGVGVRLLQYASINEALVFKGAEYWQTAVSGVGQCALLSSLDTAITAAQKAKADAGKIQ